MLSSKTLNRCDIFACIHYDIIDLRSSITAQSNTMTMNIQRNQSFENGNIWYSLFFLKKQVCVCAQTRIHNSWISCDSIEKWWRNQSRFPFFFLSLQFVYQLAIFFTSVFIVCLYVVVMCKQSTHRDSNNYSDDDGSNNGGRGRINQENDSWHTHKFS